MTSRASGHARALRSAAATLALIAVVGGYAQASDPVVDLWRAADSKTRAAVVSLARRAFDAYVLRHETVAVPASLPEIFRRRCGVFVSTMKNGAPRCCMGTLYPMEPDAAHEIVANAAAAGGYDRRFPPIKPGETKDLLLIVSIVGRPRPISVSEAAALDPTRDGLAVKFRDRYGVVLSGETSRTDLMLKWARIRAGAKPTDTVELFALDTVRFAEPSSPSGKEHGPAAGTERAAEPGSPTDRERRPATERA